MNTPSNMVDTVPVTARGGWSSSVDRVRRILAVGPRSGDYLGLPPGENERVEKELERARSVRPDARPSRAEEHHVRQDRTLEYPFSGRTVACLRTDAGVIVLAVGGEEIAVLFDSIPADNRRGVTIEFPGSW